MESKMPNPTRIEINCETGVESIIELTDAEVAELTYQAELAAEKRAEEEAAKTALEAKKQEVLAKLGLTANEVAALLA
jgi:tRNA threonylcarbamoyladenosine modification (KEOPS) complex  Pcc1 subunit